MNPKLADPKVVENALKIKEAHKQSLLSKPNVIGVGVGFKYVGGNRTEEIAISILVKKKEDVPAADAIPSVIEGVKTDVLEQEIVPAVLRVPVNEVPTGVAAPEHVDTLVGGLSFGPCRAFGGYTIKCFFGCYLAGTLGVIVTKDDNKYYALSNFHVLCVDSSWKKGDDVAQPSVGESGSCPDDVIGQVDSGCFGDYLMCRGKQVDAALCTVTGRGVSNRIKNIGAVEGSAAPMVGASVRKQGRTTGLTYGTIVGVGYDDVCLDYDMMNKEIKFKNVTVISADTTKNPKFAREGDSGSAIVDDENQVLGLLFSVTLPGYTPVYAYACDFRDVEIALGIRLYVDLPAGPYFFLFKKAGRIAQIYNYHLDGTTQMWQSTWNSEWDIIRSFKFENNYCLFSYDAYDGSVALDRINSDVQGTTEVWDGSWSTGWTIIEPFELNDNAYLVELKGDFGTLALDQIKPGLQGTKELWRGTWKGPWSIIKPFIVNGYVFLFGYDTNFGKVAIVQIDSDFTKGTHTVWNDKWAEGYTTIQPFYMNGNVYLFEYKSGTGFVAIDQLHADLQGVTTVWKDKWSKGWTNIQLFNVDDAVYLLAYKAGDGTVSFERIDPSTMIPAKQCRDKWVSQLTAIQYCFDVSP